MRCFLCTFYDGMVFIEEWIEIICIPLARTWHMHKSGVSLLIPSVRYRSWNVDMYR